MAYRIFVSHVWRAHHDYYWGLIRLLDRAKWFTFVDLSVPKLRPFDGDYADVRDDILGTLRTADVVLTINTPAITNSPAVQDELNEAEKAGVPIIAIRVPRRHGRARRSSFPALERAHKAHWTTKSIVGTIRNVVRKRRDTQAAAPVLSADQAYEPVDVAAAAVPLTPAEVANVRGDDERLANGQNGPPATEPLLSASSHAQEERPKDVLFKETLTHIAPKQPWYKRVWLAIGLNRRRRGYPSSPPP